CRPGGWNRCLPRCARKAGSGLAPTPTSRCSTQPVSSTKRHLKTPRSIPKAFAMSSCMAHSWFATARYRTASHRVKGFAHDEIKTGRVVARRRIAGGWWMQQGTGHGGEGSVFRMDTGGGTDFLAGKRHHFRVTADGPWRPGHPELAGK